MALFSWAEFKKIGCSILFVWSSITNGSCTDWLLNGKDRNPDDTILDSSILFCSNW
jgi:hypothetical protein